MNKTASGPVSSHKSKPAQPPPEESPAGILPAQAVRTLIERGAIQAGQAITPDQIQPASLDLRLGNTAYRLRASFLPGRRFSVMEKVKNLVLHKIDLSAGAVLETGCVYLVPLMETLTLSDTTAALANPKSSTGRLDIFTRVITDHCTEFDKIEAGYRGQVFLEVSPRTFPVLVRQGSRLSQIRFRCGAPTHSDAELGCLHETVPLVNGAADIDNGLGLSADLEGGEQGLVGYRARRHSAVIDIDKSGACDVLDFWDPVYVRREARIILDPDEFYILASREQVHVPATHAAEMIPYNPLVGEFRVHYAGFFDPGFGSRETGGARAVLEVRSHEVPFILEHGQIIGRLVYERLTQEPVELYGRHIGSSYQGQGLKLSRHFRMS